MSTTRNPHSKSTEHSDLPKYVYPEGERWRAAVTLLGGRLQWRRFATQIDAVTWQTWAQSQIDQGASIDTWLSPNAGKTPRFHEACDAWERHFIDQNRELRSTEIDTYRNRLKVVKDFFGDRELSQINVLAVGKFAKHLADARGVAKKTAYRYLNVVRSVFTLGVSMGWMSANPAADIKAVRPSGPTREMGKRVRIRSGQYIKIALRLGDDRRPCFWTQALCGLRAGETFGLKVRDFDIASGYITVERQRGADYGDAADAEQVNDELKKSGGRAVEITSRRVAVPDALSEYLIAHLQRTGKLDKPDAFLFDLPSNASYATYIAAVGNALLAEGVVSTKGKKLSTHTLRYNYSNIIVDANPSAGVRSRALGHVDAGTARVTARYYTDANLTKADLDEVRAIMNSFVKRLGGSLGDLVDPGPGEDWLPVVGAAQMASYQSDLGVIRFAERNNVRVLRYKFAGNNVANIFVHQPDLLAAIARRDRTPHATDLAASLDLSVAQYLRAVRELELAAETPADVVLQTVRGHLDAGESFRRSHLNRAAAADMLRATPHQMSGYIATGRLTPVAPIGFQSGTIHNWFDRAAVRALAKQVLPTDVLPLNPDLYVSASEACRLLGVSHPTLYRRLKDGTFESVADGRRTYITGKSIAAALRGNDRRTPPAA